MLKLFELIKFSNSSNGLSLNKLIRFYGSDHYLSYAMDVHFKTIDLFFLISGIFRINILDKVAMK